MLKFCSNEFPLTNRPEQARLDDVKFSQSKNDEFIEIYDSIQSKLKTESKKTFEITFEIIQHW